METSEAQTNQSNPFNYLANVLSQISNIPQQGLEQPSFSKQLCAAISRLADAINTLANSITNLQTLTPKTDNITVVPALTRQKEQFKSYANAVQNNVSTFSKTIQPTPQYSSSPRHEVGSDDFMTKLASLKNTRNEAYYRMRRNELCSEMYLRNLNAQPRKVPRKFLPNIVCHRDPALLQHRNEMAIQAVSLDIKAMKIHQEKQRQKLERYDQLINDHINSEPNESKRIVLKNNCSRIIARSNAAIEQKLIKKIDFFESLQHMFVLHEVENLQQDQNKSSEQGPIDCLAIASLDHEMSVPTNHLKRTRDTSMSQETQSTDSGTIAAQQQGSSVQRSAKKTTTQHVFLNSKNWTRLGKKKRLKPLSQK